MTEEQLNNLTDEELEKMVIDERANAVQEPAEEAPQAVEEEVAPETEEPNTTEEISEPVSEEVEQPTEQVVQETPQPKTYKIKANGMEYDFSEDELIRLAPKAMDYTKKMQTIAPYRRTISAIEQNGISEDDINLLIDIKKGNKDAISSLIKSSGIDVYDLPENDGKYTPTRYAEQAEAQNTQDVIARLARDPEFEKTKSAFEVLDPQSKQYLLSNTENIEGLHDDVKNGIYEKVMPEALKLAALDGYQQPVLQYYFKAGQDYFTRQEQIEKQAIATKAKEEAIRTRAKASAALPSSRADKKSVINYLDEDNDDEYNAWYKSLQNRF